MTTTICTFRLIDQQTLQAFFLIRSLDKHRGRNLRVGVTRILATNRVHVSWNAASPSRSESRPTRELHAGRVGRVVFNWALLHADEDDYERRI
jgi:hypothetical protein